ncbi:MAG: alpha/beta hydrolase [Prosthecobacter sp.]|nr:alpha/beta hydrolase [Prosthecobacter sp.]
MKTIIGFFCLALGTASSFAVEMVIHRDLPYTEPKNERQCLDMYTGAGAKAEEGKSKRGGPVVVWIHGGGWRQGDKSQLAVGTPEQHLRKPQAIVDRGGVFVAINYRFVPNVDLKTMTGDVAKAIGWVKRHAPEYSGDPEKIMAMGHSAGAQLAALVCTDERYLQAEGLTLRDIKGCMPVDGGSFYVPLQVEASDPKKTAAVRKVFPEGSERELSSVLHIGPNKGKGIPPFLVLCLADRLESNTKIQSEILVHYLRQAGVPAKLVAVAGKTHPTINADLGLPGEEVTRAMVGMVEEVTGK